MNQICGARVLFTKSHFRISENTVGASSDMCISRTRIRSRRDTLRGIQKSEERIRQLIGFRNPGDTGGCVICGDRQEDGYVHSSSRRTRESILRQVGENDT